MHLHVSFSNRLVLNPRAHDPGIWILFPILASKRLFSMLCIAELAMPVFLRCVFVCYTRFQWQPFPFLHKSKELRSSGG